MRDEPAGYLPLPTPPIVIKKKELRGIYLEGKLGLLDSAKEAQEDG
jgi:hypothetical protein